MSGNEPSAGMGDRNSTDGSMDLDAQCHSRCGKAREKPYVVAAGVFSFIISLAVGVFVITRHSA